MNNRTRWDRMRVEEYAFKKNISLDQARQQIYGLYMPGMNVAAVDAIIDPVVDEPFQSHNRPPAGLSAE